MSSIHSVRRLGSMIPAAGLILLLGASCTGSGKGDDGTTGAVDASPGIADGTSDDSHADEGAEPSDLASPHEAAADAEETGSPEVLENPSDACVPDCLGRNCGPNGCGGECGTCLGGQCRDPYGVCVPDPECPYLGYRACDGDGYRTCTRLAINLDDSTYADVLRFGEDRVACLDAACIEGGRCACTFAECAGRCCAYGDTCYDGHCCPPGSTAPECTPAPDSSKWERCDAFGGQSIVKSITDYSSYCVQTGGDIVFYVPAPKARLFPMAVPGGGFLVAADDQGVIRMDARGKVLWHTPIAGEVLSKPVLGPKGMVLVSSTDHQLHALAGDGSPAWQYKTSGWMLGSPVVAADGTIYVAGMDRMLRALAPDGSVKWTCDADAAITGPPILLDDGTVLVATEAGRILAVHANGSVRWSSDTTDPIASAPAVAGDWIIASGRTAPLVAMGAADGREAAIFRGRGTATMPAVVGDQIVVVNQYDPANTVVCPNDGFNSGIVGIRDLGGSVRPNRYQFVTTLHRTEGGFCRARSEAAYGHVLGPPVIDDVGTLYAATSEGSLNLWTHLTANVDYYQEGVYQSWEVRFPGRIDSPPVLADNMVVVGCRDGHLYGVSRPRVIDVSVGTSP